MARPAPAPDGSVTETASNIELAIHLLEAGNAPEEVEAALVYRGSTKEAAKALVQGILSGRIQSAPSGGGERVPKDWAWLPGPTLLALGLPVVAWTIFVAARGRVIFLYFLVVGLLISCAGLERTIGPKHRKLSIALCFILIALSFGLARFL